MSLKEIINGVSDEAYFESFLNELETGSKVEEAESIIDLLETFNGHELGEVVVGASLDLEAGRTIPM